MTRPRVRIRIEFAAGRWLGPGKIELLEAVRRLGSLTGAAADCGMSYKRAWGLLQAANEIFAKPLVTMNRGGRGGGGGARVTAEGEAVVAAYRQAEREAAVATEKTFAGFRTSSRRASKRA
jgi:molybdate transport system regulatory protein